MEKKAVKVYSDEQLAKIKSEFSRLKGECYLDHAGATLYSEKQMEHVFSDLSKNIYANPHARNTHSQSTGDIVDIVRYQILSYFNTTQEKYAVVFTSGATHALKLIGETFEFNGGTLAYLEDNHTSVLGMRNFAPNFRQVKVADAFNILSGEFDAEKCNRSGANGLFVYPAESNFSGTKYPLSWLESIKQGILNKTSNRTQNWYTLLDAACFVSTNHLDLNRYSPDFVAISFYKMFGYPTGLGALLVKRSSEELLKKKYFGGGTVLMSLSSKNVMIPRPNLYERFEDGTISFLTILSLRHGFDTFKRLQITPQMIGEHTFNLAKFTFDNLSQLHHANGEPVVLLYHDTNFDSCDTQGGIVNFNLRRSDGTYVGYAEVLHIANLHEISLRTGCFCNPGACQRFLKLSSDDVRKHFEAGHVCGDQHDLVDGYPTGSVRISFGYMSTYEDADRFLTMIEKCFVVQPVVRKIRKLVPGLIDRNKEVVCSNNNNSVKMSDSNSKLKETTTNGFDEPLFEPNGKSNNGNLNQPTNQEIDNPIPEETASDSETIQSNELEATSSNKIEFIYMDESPLTKTNDEIMNVNDEVVKITTPDKNWKKIKPEDLTTKMASPLQNKIRKKVFGKLTKIFLYPVKSCGAYSVEDSWELTNIGLKYDRRWMIVNAAGSCVSQKQLKKLCTVKPTLDIDGNKLKLTMKGAKEISVPLEPQEIESKEAFFCDSKVCGDKVLGYDCGDEVAGWLSEHLEKPGLRLLRQCEFSGEISGRSSKNGEQTMLSLANKAEYLLVNNASVRWLRERIPQEDALCLTEETIVSRFRANFVVDFGRAFVENDLDVFQFADVLFKFAGNCARCQMICIDQETGDTFKEPLQTLSKEMKGKINFGIYLRQINVRERNVIRIGCEVSADLQTNKAN